MAFKLKGAVDIKATPEADAPLLITMFGQTLFGTGQTATDSTGAGWTNVLIPPGLVDGWVHDTEVTSTPDPGPLPLDLESFVRQCMLVDRSLNAEPSVAPNLITADFLIARAIIETGLTQAKFTGAILNGPFRLAQAEWDAFSPATCKSRPPSRPRAPSTRCRRSSRQGSACTRTARPSVRPRWPAGRRTTTRSSRATSISSTAC